MYAAELLIENPLLAYIISLGINTDFLCKLINIDGQYCFKPVQKFANLFFTAQYFRQVVGVLRCHRQVTMTTDQHYLHGISGYKASQQKNAATQRF